MRFDLSYSDTSALPEDHAAEMYVPDSDHANERIWCGPLPLFDRDDEWEPEDEDVLLEAGITMERDMFA